MGYTRNRTLQSGLAPSDAAGGWWCPTACFRSRSFCAIALATERAARMARSYIYIYIYICVCVCVCVCVPVCVCVWSGLTRVSTKSFIVLMIEYLGAKGTFKEFNVKPDAAPLSLTSRRPTLLAGGG